MLELTEKDFTATIIKSIQQAILSVFKPIRKHKSSVKKQKISAKKWKLKRRPNENLEQKNIMTEIIKLNG